jgi:hypothetical protein
MVGGAVLVNITSSVEVQAKFVIVHLNVALVPAGTPVTPEVGEEGVVIVAVPLTTLHAPVPTVAVLPASVNVLVLQLAWSVPALAVVGGTLLFVSTTSSVDGIQGLFEIVHLKVALVPAGTPVTPEVGEDGVVIVAVPLTTLHAPVPTVAVLPASVNELVLHFTWSAPALAVVGDALLVRITSSVDMQAPFVIVHLKVGLVPAGTPVTPEVGKEGVVIVAVPLTTLHTPVPIEGGLPARVKLLLLQLTWSVPAFAVVGVALFVNTTSSVDGVQGLFEIVHLKVALVPTGTPVTPDVGEDGVVIVAVPLTTLHAPVPTVAVLPASVKVLVLHLA